MIKKINIGRFSSGGVFWGLFGNPTKEKEVNADAYRIYFRAVMINSPEPCDWLRDELKNGAILYCPGCGLNSPTCHARIIEEELLK